MSCSKSNVLSETELYRPVCDYLTAQGYTVRGEVKDCDIVAVKGDDLVIIELKRNLCLALLVQAVERQSITDAVYVAIPEPSNRSRWMTKNRGAQKVLKRLEIGLMLVSPSTNGRPRVEILFHAVPATRRKRKSARNSILMEAAGRSGDFNEGGGRRRKIITAYRENAIHIACCLARFGPQSPANLRSLETGSRTLSILYRNVYGWFERVGYGVYAISPKGVSQLKDYPKLVEHYQNIIAEKTGDIERCFR